MTDLAWMRPKLAELCGLHEVPAEHAGGTYYRHGADDPTKSMHWPDVLIRDWRPDEDVAQAVRCLESLNRWTELTYGGDPGKRVWLVSIADKPEATPLETDKSLPRAICLAIAAALGWEKP